MLHGNDTNSDLKRNFWSTTMRDEQNTWKLVNSRTLLTDPWLKVYEKDYELPDGSRLEGYHAMEERNGVLIVALTGQHEVLMVRQYRPGVDGLVYEVPAGFLEDEDNEADVLQRAKKELQEETGYEAEVWHALGVIHDAPHRIKKTSYCFLALNAHNVSEQQEDQTEFVEYELISLAKVRDIIEDGEVTSAVTIAAFFKALLVLERICSA
jgi:8-oxo-dGTP pyrophosphatase MutT (NUDIX family)